ncbi:copper amine oxidase N-terminal domain-containing protein [Paenibacillus sp. BR2-3]|uniref:copper amine oxidase N-terminal domain-containing protein n=1 Tax=Paenibacillus sp. BR2-3 TaxID=3048494 RepID=UPI003977A36F
MNKKVFIFMLACMLFLVIPKPSFAATENPDIYIKVNGVTLISLDSMYMENGTALVYYRFFFESLGMTVDLDHSTGRIQVFDGGESEPLLTLWLDSKKVSYKGKNWTLPVPVRRIGNLTYIPVRSIGELLGYQVQFNKAEQIICLTKKIPGESDKISPVLDAFFKEGQVNPSREIFSDSGWEDYRGFEPEIGVPFNFLPLLTSSFKVNDIIYLSENHAFVKVSYASSSAVFKREIDFTFSVTKKKQDWKLSGFYMGNTRHEMAEGAREEGAAVALQAKEAASVMADLEKYSQAWKDDNAAAILQSTSPVYINEYEAATGVRYENALSYQSSLYNKKRASETFIPYLSDDHAVVYVSELQTDVDDDGKLVKVQVDTLIRMDKTEDGRWTVHSKLELVDFWLAFSL